MRTSSPELACGAQPKAFESYPGSKDASGTAETIISLFPMHSVYIEPFLGNGAVMRKKTPALWSVGIDKDPQVIAAWRRVACAGLEVIEGCGIEWMERGGRLPADALVYCDPPYVLSTRKGRRIYRCELSDADHERLISAIEALPCAVFISGYESELYTRRLAGWPHTSFPAMTRGGLKTEHLWWRSTIANFSVDARYAGRGFRERERIKRKVNRWVGKFETLPLNERWAVLSRLTESAREIARGSLGPAMKASAAAPDDSGDGRSRQVPTAGSGDAGHRDLASPKVASLPATSLFPAVLQKTEIQ